MAAVPHQPGHQQPELPRDLVDRIMAHADGVPLFIEELTKTVLQKGLTYSRW